MTALTNEQIGENIAYIRQNAGISMDGLADAMRRYGHKWTRVTVFNIEHGKRQLKFQEAVDLLNALHLDHKKGMEQLMSESVERQMVQKEVWAVDDALDALRTAIFSLRIHRRHLDTYLTVINDPKNEHDLNYEELRESCKDLEVQQWVYITSEEDIIRIIRDLYSVTFDEMFPQNPTEWQSGWQDIEIFRTGEGEQAHLFVSDEVKDYRADDVKNAVDGD